MNTVGVAIRHGDSRHNRQYSVGRRTSHHLGQKRVAPGGRKMPQTVVYGPQFDVRDHAEKPLPPPLNGNERPHWHILNRGPADTIQPHLQTARQLPADHNADLTTRCPRRVSKPSIPVALVIGHTAISRSMVYRRCDSPASSIASIRPARIRNPRRSATVAAERCKKAVIAKSAVREPSAISNRKNCN